ncbi:MAG: hypothetical protein ACKV0T_12575, partial [Planctomycetales bacterium]
MANSAASMAASSQRGASAGNTQGSTSIRVYSDTKMMLRQSEKITLTTFLFSWFDRVVPFAVEFCARDAEALKFRVGDP